MKCSFVCAESNSLLCTIEHISWYHVRISSGRRKEFLRRIEDIEGSELWLEIFKSTDSVEQMVLTLDKRVAGLDRSTAEKIDDVVLTAGLNLWNKEGVHFLACVLCSFEL